MNFKMFEISILVVLSVITKTQGCEHRNISYDDIKTDDGFKFSYQCPEGSEIFVYENETTIAYRGPGNQSFECSPEVHRVNNHSVVTRGCQDLKIKCLVPNGVRHVQEICVDYKITGKAMRCGKPSFGKIMDAAQQSSWDKFECNTIKEIPEPGDPPTPWGLIIGVPLSVLVIVGIVGIVGMFCCCYTRWKKKQHGAATASGFFSYLRTGCCLRKNSQAKRGEEQETGVAESDSVQEVIADNSGTQQNGAIRTSGMSASDPHGRRESDIQPDDTLGNVLVDSIDRDADGTTPQSFSLDRNLSNRGTQPAENGDTSTPDVNRAMNRCLRDDPGGVCYNKEKDAVWITAESSEWTHGDGGREDHGSEEQPLLSYQGAALQGADMTGEASDQVSRCSTAPDADVESTLKIKNYGEHK